MSTTSLNLIPAPQWAWMGGSNRAGQPAQYGIEHQMDDSNIPGGRWGSAWGFDPSSDSGGLLRIFGGSGVISGNRAVVKNDLWMLSTGQGGHGRWGWMGGSQLPNVPGVYGSKYQFDPNNCPGVRESAAAWGDQSGRLWIFGGAGCASASWESWLNDFWLYDPTQGSYGEWVWIGGSSNVAGGQGPAGVYGSQYQFAADNAPGGRARAATWTDQSGRLWLFGGFGAGSSGGVSELNDLWVFDPRKGLIGEWAWMSGSQVAQQPGVYGSESQFDAANTPGARFFAASWTDSRGWLWLFGGSGFDAAGNFGKLNDLWVFDPGRGTWAWMRGSNTLHGNVVESVYGSQYQFAATNTPGGRDEAATWVDQGGRLWLFGGLGYDSAGNLGKLNDLWVFDVSQGAGGEWAWMGGSTKVGQNGMYGAEYQFAAGNWPGARTQAATWTDPGGNLWLFGGEGFDSAGSQFGLSDLWALRNALGVRKEGMQAEWA